MIIKQRSALVFPILLVFFLFVAFLAWQVMRLKSDYGVLVAQNQSLSIEVRSITKNLETLNKDFTQNQEAFKEVWLSMKELSQTLPKDLKTEFRNLFLTNPDYAIVLPTFHQEQVSENVIQVTGYKGQLQRWMKQNEFFLDHIVKKSLVLDWDGAQKKVVVQEVMDDSYFYKLGLRKGDFILSVDQVAYTRGDEIRSRLFDLEPKKVVLLRGETRLTLDVQYKDQDVLALDVTQEEFLKSLPEDPSVLEASPVQTETVVGVKLNNVESVPALQKLNFQKEDVVTKIGGQAVTQENFLESLRSLTSKSSVEFFRGDKTHSVAIDFAN